MIVWIVVGVIVLVIVVWAVAAYNKLVSLQNRFENAFAQIDVQLKRRHDLIPNLVETAKAYMAHERETLEAVIAARNQAVSAEQEAKPSDPAAMRKLMGAEGALTGALGRLFAVMEAYPDLKANQNMMQLSEELTTTENRVAFARQAYNDGATQYNTYREKFPANVVASMSGFPPAALWEIEDPTHREAPQVSFS